MTMNFPNTETPEEIMSLYERLDIIHDLYDKYNIYYNNNTYEYDEICPLVRKKFEKEIEKYKNDLVKFLKLMIVDYKLKDYVDINDYSLNEIICGFSRCIYGRCDEVEELILRSSRLAAEYANEVIRGRWESFEYNIPKYPDDERNVKTIYDYCRNNKYVSEEAENKIKNFPELAYHYALNVKKERWIEGESAILKNIEQAFEYVCHLGFMWPEYEKKIRNKPKRIFEYAKSVVKGKLPEELHNRMLMNKMAKDDPYAEHYFDWLKESEDYAVFYMRSISPEEREVLLKKI